MNIQSNTTKAKENLSCLSTAELRSLNLRKGDTVQLTNGKLYKVINYYARKNRVLLYSKEYDKKFFVDHKIVHNKFER